MVATPIYMWSVLQDALQRAEQAKAAQASISERPAAAGPSAGAHMVGPGTRKHSGKKVAAAATRPAVELEDDDPFASAGPRPRGMASGGGGIGGGGSSGFVETERDRLIRTVRMRIRLLLLTSSGEQLVRSSALVWWWQMSVSERTQCACNCRVSSHHSTA